MNKLFLCYAIIFTLLPTCSSLQVDASYDRQRDYSTFKTYDWYPAKEKSNKKFFRDIRVTDEIHKELKRILDARGLVRDEKNPDLLVEYHGTVDKTYEEERGPVFSGMYYSYSPFLYPGPGPMVPYYGGYYSGRAYGYNNAPYRMPYIASRVESYKESTLIIDLVELKSNTLIWRGWAEQSIDNVADLKSKISDQIGKLDGKLPKDLRVR